MLITPPVKGTLVNKNFIFVYSSTSDCIKRLDFAYPVNFAGFALYMLRCAILFGACPLRMTGFTIAPAQLAALFMQSISFGVHLVTFGACMYTWFCRSGSSGPSTHASLRWMVIAIAFFVVGTCDVSFNFYHNLLAFVKYKGPGGANAEFSDASNWVNVIRVSGIGVVVTSNCQTHVGDLSERLAVYRRYSLRRGHGVYRFLPY